MKKAYYSLLIFLSVLFVVPSMMEAQSLNPIELPPVLEDSIYAYVTLENLETGEKIPLIPQLVSFKTDNISNESSSQELPTDVILTYEVGIPTSLLGGASTSTSFFPLLVPSIAYANDSKYKCDNTSSVCANFTF